MDHREDLAEIRSFIDKGLDGNDPEGDLSPHVRWYLRELREDLKEIFSSGALRIGVASHFAIPNHPPHTQAIDTREWHPKTIAFIETLRLELEQVIKPRYVDDWLQTSKQFLGDLSPIQVIQCGGGERIRALIQDMKTGYIQ